MTLLLQRGFMKLEKCFCFKTFSYFGCQSIILDFAIWLLFLVLSWSVGMPREWSWNQNCFMFTSWLFVIETYVCLYILYPHQKKIHKGVADYSDTWAWELNLLSTFCTQFNNYFMRQRAYVEILSPRKVWRARKRRKSCSRSSRRQL